MPAGTRTGDLSQADSCMRVAVYGVDGSTSKVVFLGAVAVRERVVPLGVPIEVEVTIYYLEGGELVATATPARTPGQGSRRITSFDTAGNGKEGRRMGTLAFTNSSGFVALSIRYDMAPTRFGVAGSCITFVTFPFATCNSPAVHTGTSGKPRTQRTFVSAF